SDLRDGLPGPGQSMDDDSLALPYDYPRPEGVLPSRDSPLWAQYNGRDCSTMDEYCAGTLADIQQNRVSELSIDITPELAPGTVDPEDRAREQNELLARIPSRVWRNRQGQVVAEGLLRNYERGQVVIVQDDGEVVRIRADELGSEEQCFLAAWWGLPVNCPLPEGELRPRDWAMTTYTWKAPALCNKPLYFENVQLEWYGHTAGPLVQPILSGAHFFGSLLLLPYQMGMHPP